MLAPLVDLSGAAVISRHQPEQVALNRFLLEEVLNVALRQRQIDRRVQQVRLGLHSGLLAYIGGGHRHVKLDDFGLPNPEGWPARGGLLYYGRCEQVSPLRFA